MLLWFTLKLENAFIDLQFDTKKPLSEWRWFFIVKISFLFKICKKIWSFSVFLKEERDEPEYPEKAKPKPWTSTAKLFALKYMKDELLNRRLGYNKTMCRL